MRSTRSTMTITETGRLRCFQLEADLTHGIENCGCGPESVARLARPPSRACSIATGNHKPPPGSPSYPLPGGPRWPYPICQSRSDASSAIVMLWHSRWNKPEPGLFQRHCCWPPACFSSLGPPFPATIACRLAWACPLAVNRQLEPVRQQRLLQHHAKHDVGRRYPPDRLGDNVEAVGIDPAGTSVIRFSCTS